ncbi:hypothetical protein AGABI2DRAFT_226039 [Agaricus bisporus var. bisporus H97]|uniref:hypothetical protein n=1 Tax=Agaricus bisporus var. bisporus (strain H97 / ATCC MYA-4626 / FGSC 10389) TaxID=936046 RepID=UPI00029F6185|nr:hypothetical protein AGABI2DRAFT_226039 [Agaricus bisporus var. bisporus H97]EKV44700.1 hypothetical protein AGABI2DRAFT_226039 [Agaricus bisporus var. bisporus H97]
MEVTHGDVPVPQPRHSLKRSASTISLPTPPRTHRRHKRGRSRGDCDSDSDFENDETLSNQESALSSDEEGGELPDLVRNPRKKRRLTQSKAKDEDEEAFWLAPPDPETHHQEEDDQGHESSAGSEKVGKDKGSSSSAPLLYRKNLQRSQSLGSTGLASPPPSHRKTQVVAPVTPPGPSTSTVLPKVQSVSPPKTPKKQTALYKGPIISDSPDNPFYEVPVSSSPEEETESPLVVSPEPATVTQHEKPTVTYVFRGVRREYHNPMYDHVKKRAFSPPPASLLPIEHEEYSPDIGCKPRVLFPKAQKGKRSAATKAGGTGAVRRSPRRKRVIVGDSEDEGGDEEDALIKPKKLDFGLPKNVSSKAKVAPAKVKSASPGAGSDPF